MENHYYVWVVRVLLMHSFMVLLVTPSTNFTDQQALLSFKERISSSPDNILADNWTTTTSFCNWIGVSCSRRRQRVTVLNLSNMSLHGTISPLLGNLSFLFSLDFSNNNFRGNIPDELGHLSRLRVLNMEYNELTGTIPPSIVNITKLATLALGANNLQGNIPKEIGNLPNLKEIYLYLNHLSGSIPPSIFNISTLQYLVLLNNSLSGSIRIDVGYRLPKLLLLELGYNQISGEIPSVFCQCGELRVLSLSFNKFTGTIPREIGYLSKLEELYLYRNSLTGTIPPSLGNISMLQFVNCAYNGLQGDVPREFGNLLHLQQLSFENNNLTGAVPQAIFNISSLQYISFVRNRLSGRIRNSIGLKLPNLKGLYLGDNQFSGEIPISISNASKLTELELSHNTFTGSVPMTLGNLRLLEFLNLENNLLSNEPSKLELHFLTSLVECGQLEFLVMGQNPLKGILPNSVGNLSTSLQVFHIPNAEIRGNIPVGIGNLTNLITLVLDNNELSGTIPSTVGRLKKLQRLYLENAEIQGSVPDELCYLNHLGELVLPENKLSGSIPSCIGNLSQLKIISLHSNKLTSTIPSSLWNLVDLKEMNLSQNSLGGYVPSDVGSLKVIDTLDLSGNKLSGNIPSTIGDLESLRYLNLSHNSFQGPIPQSFGSLISLEFMDLSSNILSGTIPSSLEDLSHLTNLNVSFNKLSGQIPNGGIFSNLTAQSFMGNEGLCGVTKLQVPHCATNTTHKSGIKFLQLKYVFPVIASTIFIVVILSLWIRCQCKKTQVTPPIDLQPMTAHRLISYQELLQATDYFIESNLLGVGSFGSVYKGRLSDGIICAIKVLNLQLEGAYKCFDAECQVMRKIRHRNLVKIISTCSNLEFRALILEYMPNGSLENWLYSHNYCLDLLQRISAMIDVAMALEYLHHDYSEPVVHCDLKPSNVLFDEDMVAHVGDFGIAKILAENKSTTQTMTLGTIGYIAPEYGSEGRVSTSGDVYSYGIMLMETFTSKKPTDEMFTEDSSLRQWVETSYPDAVMEVLDANLFNGEEGNQTTRRQQRCLSSIFELALECSRDSPEERINMKDVVVRFKKIRVEVLANE